MQVDRAHMISITHACKRARAQKGCGHVRVTLFIARSFSSDSFNCVLYDSQSKESRILIPIYGTVRIIHHRVQE